MLNSCFAPMKTRVKEEVNSSLDLHLSRIGSFGARHLHLQFANKLRRVVFTGNKIVSEDKSPMKVMLYDSATRNVVRSGPYSSIKVEIVALEGDLDLDSSEEWSKKDFDSKIIQNRQGKRPLVTGESSIISLKDGVGYVSDLSFTDNSSWTRSCTFRLGVKVYPGSDGASIREGISNAFRVKDQRGENYQKHYPPLLEDEVWRLEKIAKDGMSHKRLSASGVSCVRGFLREYNTNEASLRAMLPKVSNKKWEAITQHAKTCPLDDQLLIYRSTDQRACLVFNSIYKVVKVTFDGLNFHSIDKLNPYDMRVVEDVKQIAYRNLDSWENYDQVYPNINPMHVGQDQLGMQMNSSFEIEKENSSFELGESSQMQELNFMTFINGFGMSGSPESFYTGRQTWASGGDHVEPLLSPPDFTRDSS